MLIKNLAASKQANIHMHMCNAVPLVWGSLRLAPITHYLGNTPKLAYLDVAKLSNKLVLVGLCLTPMCRTTTPREGYNYY